MMSAFNVDNKQSRSVVIHLELKSLGKENFLVKLVKKMASIRDTEMQSICDPYLNVRSKDVLTATEVNSLMKSNPI